MYPCILTSFQKSLHKYEMSSSSNSSHTSSSSEEDDSILQSSGASSSDDRSASSSGKKGVDPIDFSILPFSPAGGTPVCTDHFTLSLGYTPWCWESDSPDIIIQTMTDYSLACHNTLACHKAVKKQDLAKCRIYIWYVLLSCLECMGKEV